MAQTDKTLSGVLGFFESPQRLLEAMKQVRDSGYECFDAFTPFAVHGMDEAMGIKRSILPYITFVMGLTGFACAFGLQVWTSVVDWPLNVGGKPFYSWPAFVPILFELTVLFAGVSTAIGMILINRLPNTKYKAFDPSITRDQFAVWIGYPGNDSEDGAEPTQGKRFEVSEVSQFLQRLGARDVRPVYNEGWQ